MADILVPRLMTANLLASTSSTVSAQHNGEPGYASVLSAIEEAVLHLVAARRVQVPGSMRVESIGTSAESYLVRCAEEPVSEYAKVGVVITASGEGATMAMRVRVDGVWSETQTVDVVGDESAGPQRIETIVSFGSKTATNPTYEEVEIELTASTTSPKVNCIGYYVHPLPVHGPWSSGRL